MAKSMILGANGQPIDVAEIHTPQTSQLGHLQRELQSHPTRGLTPSKLAAILDAAEQGDLTAQFDLFEDMEEKDGHIASEMGKRRRACLVDWEILPPDNASALENRNAQQLGELVQSIPDLEDVIFDATDAIGKGFACLEIEWHREEKLWVPKSITHRPQSWFQLHRGYRQELRLRSNTADAQGIQGTALNPFGWITHVHKAKSGYLERTALFRQLVWTYLFKNYSVGDLAEFLEIYGIPVRLGKYPPNASEKEKATLLRALVGIGHNAAGIIPDGMLIDFKEAATGDPKAFELMISWCERNQSKVILGGTLTSGADGKSSTNALGNVHNEVRKDLRDGDLRQLNTTLTRDLVYAMATLNGLAPDGIKRCPRMQLTADETEDMESMSNSLPKLVAIGVQVPKTWANRRLGIPLPQAGEEVLAPAPTATAANAVPAVPGTPPAAAAALTAQPAPVQPRTVAGAMLPQLARQADPAAGGWVTQLRELVMRANSLQDIRDGLEQLLPNMTLDQYASALADALATAELAGRHDVLQEAASYGH
jgi:phage gp29-like protein